MLSYKIVIEQRVVQSSRLVFLYFFQRDKYFGVEKESRHLPSSCVQCNGKGGPLYPLASLTVFVQSSCVVRLPCRRRPRRKKHRCSSSSLSFIVVTVDVYALASVHLRVCSSSALLSWSSSSSSCVLGPDMRTVFGRFVKRVSPFTIRLVSMLTQRIYQRRRFIHCASRYPHGFWELCYIILGGGRGL